jgi:hypothetical protein
MWEAVQAKRGDAVALAIAGSLAGGSGAAKALDEPASEREALKARERPRS